MTSRFNTAEEQDGSGHPWPWMELEQQIRELPCLQPSAQLDDRIERLLCSAEFCSNVNPVGSTSASPLDLWGGRSSGRVGAWLSTACLCAACVCLGWIMGHIGATRTAASDEPAIADGGSGIGVPFRGHHGALSATGEDSMHLLQSVAQASGVGRTAIERAAWWEQQTGQVFPVANHVADAKFDFCRLCHLAEAQENVSSRPEVSVF